MKKNSLLLLLIISQIIILNYSINSAESIDQTKIIEIIKLSANRERKGYNGSPIWNNKIDFYVDKNKVNDLNDFPSLFHSINISLKQDEIYEIHNFIGYISENASDYKNLRINLVDVYNNLNYLIIKLEENANQNNKIIDKIVEKLVNFNTDKGFDGSNIFKNKIKLYVKGYEVYNLEEFNNQFLMINLDLNIIEKYKIYTFINYISNNVNEFKDKKFNLYYVYEKYAKSGDSFNDVAKIKTLNFINNNDYELEVSNEPNGIINYIYTNINYSNDTISKIESKIIRELDNIKCNKATSKNIIDLYDKPTKVILCSDRNNIHVNYMYGELFLYFGNQDKLIEKRFLIGFGITEIKFAYQGKIKLGSTLDEVLNYFGNPKTIIDGKPNDFQDDILYKNIDGKKGYNYICYKSKGIRIFFYEDKISTFILFD